MEDAWDHQPQQIIPFSTKCLCEAAYFKYMYFNQNNSLSAEVDLGTQLSPAKWEIKEVYKNVKHRHSSH